MALEFFDGAAWRPISPDEAKYRHAEGQGDRLRDLEVEAEMRDEEPAQANEPAAQSAPVVVENPAPAVPPAPPQQQPPKPTRERQR